MRLRTAGSNQRQGSRRSAQQTTRERNPAGLKARAVLTVFSWWATQCVPMTHSRRRAHNCSVSRSFTDCHPVGAVATELFRR